MGRAGCVGRRGQTLNPGGYRHDINLSYCVRLHVSHQQQGGRTAAQHHTAAVVSQCPAGWSVRGQSVSRDTAARPLAQLTLTVSWSCGCGYRRRTLRSGHYQYHTINTWLVLVMSPRHPPTFIRRTANCDLPRTPLYYVTSCVDTSAELRRV